MRLASFAGLASMDSAAQSAEIEVTQKQSKRPFRLGRPFCYPEMACSGSVKKIKEDLR
jgi:hypothetical protein